MFSLVYVYAGRSRCIHAFKVLFRRIEAAMHLGVLGRLNSVYEIPRSKDLWFYVCGSKDSVLGFIFPSCSQQSPDIHVYRGELIMLKNSPTMLCCTAQNISQLITLPVILYKLIFWFHTSYFAENENLSKKYTKFLVLHTFLHNQANAEHLHVNPLLLRPC